MQAIPQLSPRPLLTALGLAAGMLCGALHAQPPPNPEGLALFETHIRPALVTECIECHGAEKQKGGLRLDSRPGWEKGGDSGPALVPGRPAESLLLRSIQHKEPDLKMPDKRPKLDDAILERFERWIALGAPDPRDTPTAAGAQGIPWPELLAARRSWWSLQPVRPGSPPASPAAPNAHPVDAFLHSAMTREGVAASPPTSTETLARRLHFILTGLPPSPAEMRSFVENETRVGRQSAVRERAALLAASPAFGEHWARHWMDLVRYAESHGSEGDPALPGAHHYRDYLIRAFEADVPLDHLIREHVAGDLLPNPRISPEGVVESRIGPAHFRMVEHGYRPVDTLDEHMKFLDNQIDVVFKAFQALTVSCARCHDHKFDAVSQRDYTALRGIFSSVRLAQIVASSPEACGASRKPEFRALKDAIRDALATVWEHEAQDLPGKLRALTQPVAQPELDALRTKLSSVEAEIGKLTWKQKTLQGTQPPVLPYALWTFESGPQDLFGRLSSELLGGAEVRDGALHLNGRTAFLRTATLPDSLRERSFEVWVSPATLDQRGGGVLSIERTRSHQFDSLVFAEKTPRKWLPGSNYFQRTLQPDGPDEDTPATAPVHLVLTYRADHSIQLFRNGAPYGDAYRKDKLQEYAGDDARILIGLRHTGAGTGFFHGRIEEARLYDRALSSADVAASFAAGPIPADSTPPAPQASAATLPSNGHIAGLRTEAENLRTEIARLSAGKAREEKARKTEPEEHPLHAAQRAAAATAGAGTSATDFPGFFAGYLTKMQTRITENRRFNADSFSEAWDLSGDDAPRWFGEGVDLEKIRCGDFRVRLHGDSALDALVPAGWGASLLLPQAGGILTSPEFPLRHRAISAYFFARNGSTLRLVPDSYPLATVGAPSATQQRPTTDWARLNVAYRLGSSVHLECATPEHHATGPGSAPKSTASEGAAEGASFLLQKIVFHDSNDSPKPEHAALAWLLEGAPVQAGDFLHHVAQRVQDAVRAWRAGTLREGQRELLQACIDKELLPTRSTASPALETAVDKYRKASATLAKPLTVPGVLENEGRNAAFLPRGDHKHPGEPVPRGFIEVLHPHPVEGPLSGRAALADRLVDPTNPLTARVLVNRLWNWVFGSGIVPTVDDFGRMGQKPAHPELLDFLAGRLAQDGWSARRMILWLVETEAFQRSSTPTESAQQKDPGNALLSHAAVRRLEAEEIRDALLAVSGELNRALYGTPVEAGTPRRSLYVRHRRAGLDPIFAAFDAPRPFTTLGRRNVTTVPAQSLLLLNDPSIQKLAAAWGQRISSSQIPLEAQVDEMFATAFGRPARESERAGALKLARENGLGAVAHALWNAKEFIYLR